MSLEIGCGRHARNTCRQGTWSPPQLGRRGTAHWATPRLGPRLKRMTPARASQRYLHRDLGVVDATAIVVGTVIGSGIFVLPNLIARSLPSPTVILGVWIVSGMLSF